MTASSLISTTTVAPGRGGPAALPATGTAAHRRGAGTGGVGSRRGGALRGGARRSGRDVAVDLARAACLVWVVAFHSLMVGAWAPGGVPQVGNAMESWSGFDALTWAGQIMPLFFLLAGFSAHAQRASADAKGICLTPAAQLASRLQRLVPAVAAAALATAVGLSLLAAGGLPPALLLEAGFRSAQPLWFLSVFALCTALSPMALRLHANHPRLTLGALVAAAIAVDAVRAATGVSAVGLINMVCVWLALQQAGFLLADGSLERVRRSRLLLAGGASLALLIVLVACGVYPANLLDAMTPPTTALLLLGVTQLCAFQVLRRWVNARTLPAWLSRCVNAINARAMTIYSWHMPTVIALAGLSLAAFGPALPPPLSASWWEGRALWLGAVGVAVWLVVRWAGRHEAKPTTRRRALETNPSAVPGSRRPGRPAALAWGAALAAVCGPLLILVLGGTVAAWVLGAALLTASARLSRVVLEQRGGTAAS